MKVSAAAIVLLSIFGIGSAAVGNSITCLLCDGSETNKECKSKTQITCSDPTQFSYCFSKTSTAGVIEKGCYQSTKAETTADICKTLPNAETFCNTCETNNCNRDATTPQTRKCLKCKDAADKKCSDQVEEELTGTPDNPIPYCYSVIGKENTVEVLRKGTTFQSDTGLTEVDVCTRITETGGLTDILCKACETNSCETTKYPDTLKCRACKDNDNVCDDTKAMICEPTLYNPKAYCYQAKGKKDNADVVSRNCITTTADVTSENVCSILTVPHETSCKACDVENCNADPPKSALKCYDCTGDDDKTCLKESDTVCPIQFDEEARCLIYDYTLNDKHIVKKGCYSIAPAITNEAVCQILKTGIGASAEVHRCILCTEEYCNGTAAFAAGFLVTIAAVFVALLH